MKSSGCFLLVVALSALTMAGCTHSTNDQEPPAGSDFAIISPRPESFVEGVVAISVSAGSISPTRIEFYVNGELLSTAVSSPWQATWDVTNLPPNTYHTLKARAYSLSDSYKTTQDVVVRIK